MSVFTEGVIFASGCTLLAVTDTMTPRLWNDQITMRKIRIKIDIGYVQRLCQTDTEQNRSITTRYYNWRQDEFNMAALASLCILPNAVLRIFSQAQSPNDQLAKTFYKSIQVHGSTAKLSLPKLHQTNLMRLTT